MPSRNSVWFVMVSQWQVTPGGIVAAQSRFFILDVGAAAIAAGSRTLFLFENGVGAINLPYDGTQIGTYNSRATHPVALLRMQEFIAKLTGQTFVIENPFAFSTKGEMCRHQAVQDLRNYLSLTFSCDGFPVRA